jgi:hypothetical protein
LLDSAGDRTDAARTATERAGRPGPRVADSAVNLDRQASTMRHSPSRSSTGWIATGVALVLCITLSARVASPGGTGDVPFADFGHSFLQSHGKAAQAGDLPVEKIRSDWCVHAVLGGFDIAYPVAPLSDKPRIEELRAICTSLLEMQSHWIDWLTDDPGKVAGAKADIAELEKWVKDWRPPQFGRASNPDKDLYKVLGAPEATTKAAARLTDALCKPDLLGVAPKEGKPVSILFAPTRHDFVELVGYAGLLDSVKQTELWQQVTTDWTTFYIGWDLVMALEYPPWSYDATFKTGIPMNKFDKTGVEQHTLLQAANAWQFACYGDDGTPYFHQALAMNLAIAVCGELNALEGDGWGYGTTGASTQPYERFVPGGNAAGGTLPAIPAAPQDTIKKGRWREGYGKDHFAAPLRKGQKNGAKQLPKSKPEGMDPALAFDSAAHFLLISADEAVKQVISAPFFGPDSRTKPYPPGPVILDYREFFRAYKCAFFNWLQTQGQDGKAPESAAHFRELLKRAYTRDETKSLEDLIKEIYGVPMSGKNGKTPSLEWKFLDWLEKGK